MSYSILVVVTYETVMLDIAPVETVPSKNLALPVVPTCEIVVEGATLIHVANEHAALPAALEPETTPLSGGSIIL